MVERRRRKTERRKGCVKRSGTRFDREKLAGLSPMRSCGQQHLKAKSAQMTDVGGVDAQGLARAGQKFRPEPRDRGQVDPAREFQTVFLSNN